MSAGTGSPGTISALPRPLTGDGAPRKVGIEVELGGLDEDAVAALVAETLGGTVRDAGPFERRVEGTSLGGITVLLDTALRNKVSGEITRRGLDLGRAVIPVEYVTEPLLPERIADLDALNAALVERGALGTEGGVALGFGVHLNVALPGTGIDAILPVLRAFALLEDWLRGGMGIDPARRLLPFVDPYGAELVDALCARAADGWDTDALTGAYLAHAASRNHALDLLPVLKDLDAARVVAAVPEMDHKTARPAFHYRLPDCRLGDPDWSIALEWSRWCAIERVAADTALMSVLVGAWRSYRSGIGLPGRWAGISGPIIEKSGYFA